MHSDCEPSQILIEGQNILNTFAFSHQQGTHHDGSCVNIWIVWFVLSIEHGVIESAATGFLINESMDRLPNEVVKICIGNNFANGLDGELSLDLSIVDHPLVVIGGKGSCPNVGVSLLQGGNIISWLSSVSFGIIQNKCHGLRVVRLELAKLVLISYVFQRLFL